MEDAFPLAQRRAWQLGQKEVPAGRLRIAKDLISDLDWLTFSHSTASLVFIMVVRLLAAARHVSIKGEYATCLGTNCSIVEVFSS